MWQVWAAQQQLQQHAWCLLSACTAAPLTLPHESSLFNPYLPSRPFKTQQVWSAHTECTASELRRAISATALDKGAPGRDENFGFGVIQSLAAHHYLKANPCGGRNVNFDRISTNPVTPSEESGRAAQTYEITIPAAMSAPVNERVALPYVLSPKTPCPSSGEPVVSAVTIGRRLRRCLPALEYVALREARTSIKETCNPAQSRGQFAFAASRAHAQAGDCYELEVTTMDNQVHHSILMFTE